MADDVIPVENNEDDVVVITDNAPNEPVDVTPTEPQEDAAPVAEEANNSAEDVLDLSDEEFEKLSIDPPVEEAEETQEASEEDSSVASEGGVSDTSAAGGSTEAREETATEESVKTPEAAKPKTESVIEPDAEKQSTATSALEVDDATAVAAYKEMFAPFKANGKTVQVRNKDEAIRLMQMGAGYTKTMMELKPQLTLVRTLKNNGIDDDALNFLIELKNGDPDAIKKLVRESGIDPLDIETGDAGQAADASYRPKDYRASETQVEFELAVTQVAGTDHGKAVLESVQREWDGQSREAAYKDPAILGVLTEQKSSGIYDQITAQVDHERMLGHLQGVSFLDAYQQVGTIMANNGLLQGSTPAPTTTVTETTGTPAQQNTNTGAEPKVLERKAAVPKTVPNNNAQARAVAPVSSSTPSKVQPKDILSMSDEEFLKLDGLERFS